MLTNLPPDQAFHLFCATDCLQFSQRRKCNPGSVSVCLSSASTARGQWPKGQRAAGQAAQRGVLEPTPGLSSPASGSSLDARCSGDDWDPKNAGLSSGGGSPTGWVGPSWFLFPTLRHQPQVAPAGLSTLPWSETPQTGSPRVPSHAALGAGGGLTSTSRDVTH